MAPQDLTVRRLRVERKADRVRLITGGGYNSADRYPDSDRKGRRCPRENWSDPAAYEGGNRSTTLCDRSSHTREVNDAVI